MRVPSDAWVLVAGKAGAGKTYWIRNHIQRIPAPRVFILDYNVNDYQDFIPTAASVWSVKTGTRREIDEFLNIVYKRGNCFAVLEEADNYLRSPSPTAQRFVNTARNRNIGCFVNVKRAKSIPPQFRTRFNRLVLFKVTLQDDIDYLEDWTGTESGSLSLLRDLDLGEHIIVDLDDQTVSDIKRL